MNRLLTACLCVGLFGLNAGAQTKSINEQLEELRNRMATLEIKATLMAGVTSTEMVAVNCSTNDFVGLVTVQIPIPLLVKCASIEPYLEGFRITLWLANTATMKLNGISGKLGHGDTLLKTFSQTTPLSTTRSLTPGMWTDIQVVLNPATAKDVRFITVSDVAFAGASPQ